MINRRLRKGQRVTYYACLAGAIAAFGGSYFLPEEAPIPAASALPFPTVQRSAREDINDVYRKYEMRFDSLLPILTISNRRGLGAKYSTYFPSKLHTGDAPTPGLQLADFRNTPVRYAIISEALRMDVARVLLDQYAVNIATQRRVSERFMYKASYGYRYLPDWIHNLFATECETPERQAQWLRMARQDRRHFSVAQLLSMRTPPASDKFGRERYYAQISALRQYMTEHARKEYLQMFVGYAIEGKSISEVLPKIYGLPPTMAQLDASVKGWLKS